MVSIDRSSIDTTLFPPTSRATYYHNLRVYHQMNVWRKLSDDNIDPLSWGWKISNWKFSPIMTYIEVGPPDILESIRCGCKGSCSSRCSFRKTGLKCAFSCKECHGVFSQSNCVTGHMYSQTKRSLIQCISDFFLVFLSWISSPS